MHTKLVLLMTLVLNFMGTLFIFALEYDNPATLGHLDLVDKMLGAYFHGVVPRTAGFNSLSTGDLTLGSQLVPMLLMFIGGGSGGDSRRYKGNHLRAYFTRSESSY